ncbi:unnamed protein product (macronuclear) [Paramecium tetraurelia]|uniref:G domain-containing protein n=1 Tax=Paramecium tetraurelia TaxID=5888 RepID=A0CZF7_PARTE|nr:uncharacterized protein GSPATT00011747001 [Paramecium tetraurelia]CAK76174.1 unnamed protein product [Paramecium tetraurelia]|eukprot:XP_001443571.1 hypothetical protein (macronuclear) [Paramecium tetraurelia strain d4-2]
MDNPKEKTHNMPQEEMLLDMIPVIQQLVEEFTRNTKNQGSVVLFVGSTGSGKSTTFNFLSGAEFKLDHNEELELKNHSNIFSKMNAGVISVTKQPNFFHNKNNNHLIIDFPGFLDTNGDWDQLLIELLFNKIVSLGALKVIYVINNPQNTLQNRGADLQEFLKQLDNPKINLILNCYMAKWPDDKLRNKIKEDLESVKSLEKDKPNLISLIDKILIKRRAAHQEDLDIFFSDEQRNIFWNEIEELTKTQIKPRIIPKSEIISKYIISKATTIIQEYGKQLISIFNSDENQNDGKYDSELHLQLVQFQSLLNNSNNYSPSQWFLNFIQICEVLTQYKFKSASNDFLKIFQYFEQFEQFIDGYQQLENINQLAQQNLEQVQKLFNIRIQYQEKIQKAEEEKRRAEEEKRRAEEEKRIAEEEKRQAEEEKRQAEEDKRRAEEEKRQAEEEKRQAEEEKRQAEVENLKIQHQVEIEKMKQETVRLQMQNLEKEKQQMMLQHDLEQRNLRLQIENANNSQWRNSLICGSQSATSRLKQQQKKDKNGKKTTSKKTTSKKTTSKTNQQKQHATKSKIN